MRTLPEDKTPLERIGVRERGSSASDKRRKQMDEQSENIRSTIASSQADTLQQESERQEQELLQSMPTAIDMQRDFGSISDVDSFINDLRGGRQRTNNQLANFAPGGSGPSPVGSRPYALTPEGNIDLSSISDPNIAWILQKESGGRVNADNPTSTAFGVGQLLRANREKYGAQVGVDPNTTDPHQQWDMFMAYLLDRYGSVEAARAFWEKNGWY